MDIKNIVFDFGGVLVDWNPRYLYEDLFDDNSEMEYFLTTICTEEWNLQQDKGRSLAEGTSILVEKFPEHKSMIQSYYAEWGKMLKTDIPENVNLLFQLNKKYHLFGLTNWSAETFPIALSRYPFFKEFKGIVISGAEKMIKPGKEIYNVLLDRYQLEANQSLFIDDNINNIHSAKELGFHTIHLDNNVILKNQLINMNVM